MSITVDRAEIKVRVGPKPATKVISSLSSTTQITQLSELNDINAENLLDGMVLVYNGSTQKWDATLTLTPGATQNLDINGGSF